MKHLRKILVCLLLVMSCALLFTACGSDVSLSFERKDLPQTTFVQGQPLDLSAGTLTVSDANGNTKVPLDDAGVTVTGFDSAVLGEQTLTISYRGAQTALKVTVVPRIATDGVDTNYFVGEPCNRERGTLVITENNGVSFTVPFSDEHVTVEEFDSSAEGEKQFKVRYQSGDKDYSDRISVHFFAADDAKFFAPRKTAYQSHEALDVTDGYFSFSANNGELKRIVNLTADMVSGFDPSRATEANRTTPLEQTLTVQYGGVTDSFKIKITYSKVTAFQKTAEKLAKYDFTQSVPAIAAEDGEEALSAVEDYLSLSKTDADYLTAAEIDAVVLPAAAYAFPLWRSEAEKYKSIFTVSNNDLVLNEEVTYAEAKDLYEELDSADFPLNFYGYALADILDNFGNHAMGEGTVEEYLGGFSRPDYFFGFQARLEIMIFVYESMKDIPENWEVSQLGTYAAKMNAVVEKVGDAQLGYSFPRNTYGVASSWRTKNDIFDILYSYYSRLDDQDAISILKEAYLPGRLEKLYEDLVDEMFLMQMISGGYIVDSTFLLYDYNDIMAFAAEIAASSGLEKNLYEQLTFDDLLYQDNKSIPVKFSELLDFLRTGAGGVYDMYYAYLGVDEFKAFIEDYLSLYGEYCAEADEAGEERTFPFKTDAVFEQKVKTMLDEYVAMAPSMQYGVLITLNPLYQSRPGAPEVVFGDDEDSRTFFSQALLAYADALPEYARDIYRDLLLALEHYARRNAIDTELASFRESIAAAELAYDALTPAQQEEFDGLLGTFYTKYTEIETRVESKVEDEQETFVHDIDFTSDEWKDTEWGGVFEDLNNMIVNAYMAYSTIAQTGQPMYPLLFSAYEYAESLADYIIENAPAEVVSAYYHQKFYVSISILETYQWTMDYALYYVRSMYTYIMRNLTYDDQVIWDYYTAHPVLKEFMLKAAAPMWAFQWWFQRSAAWNPDQALQDLKKGDRNQLYGTAEMRQSLLDAMKLYRGFTIEEKEFYQSMDSAYYSFYFTMMTYAFDALPTDAAFDAAEQVIDLEDSFVTYMIDPKGKYDDGTPHVEDLKSCAKRMKELYAALEGDDKDAFDASFGEMYNYYIGEYDKLGLPEPVE